MAVAVDATGWIVVEAPTAAKAKEIAMAEFFPDERNTELNDAYKVTGCEEISEGEYEKRKDD